MPVKGTETDEKYEQLKGIKKMEKQMGYYLFKVLMLLYKSDHMHVLQHFLIDIETE